jgi:starch-binding outer membrane protein, SusD/RagB family
MNCILNLLNRTTKFVYLNILMLVASLVVISSCTDVLDQTPLDRFSDDAVWKDASLIEAFVNNAYRIHPAFQTNHRCLSTYTDETMGRAGATDLIVAGYLTPSSLQTSQIDFWSGSIGIGKSYWPLITKCNLFLANIDAAPIDDAKKTRMTGEMKVLRAWSYFRLVSMFGGVPIVTKPFKLDEDFKMPRNSVEECINFVVKDLDDAMSLLPLEYDNANKGRVTKGAAMAIKSRALLYFASPLWNPSNDMTRWQKAADAAKAVMDLNKYSLYPQYKEMFLRPAIYNQEMIWQRPYNNQVDPETTIELAFYPNGYSGYGQMGPIQSIVDAYEMTSGKLPKDDPTYDPQNPYVNRDPRFYACILYDGAMFKGRAVETFLPGGKDSKEGPISGWNATPSCYYLRKFIDESINNPSTTATSDTPWTFCRYAEILLNYAEAKYFLGDEATCRQYINMIRSRPGVNMPPVTESGAALLERLQNERRIELFLEEHRWFDARRWKIAPVVFNKDAERMDVFKDPATGKKTFTITPCQTRKWVDKMYYLPIPQSEMDKNPSFVQNPGY